jgi:hypothetical protein
MVSRTPVQIIEDHSEQITNKVIRLIRKDPELPKINRLPESELRDRALEVLRNLGHWLSASRWDELAGRYERLGRERFEESFRLHETVRCFHILRESMIDFVREQGVLQSSVELYAEEELEYRMGRFFDNLVYHVVRGYEEALRKTLRPAS